MPEKRDKYDKGFALARYGSSPRREAGRSGRSRPGISEGPTSLDARRARPHTPSRVSPTDQVRSLPSSCFNRPRGRRQNAATGLARQIDRAAPGAPTTGAATRCVVAAVISLAQPSPPDARFSERTPAWWVRLGADTVRVLDPATTGVGVADHTGSLHKGSEELVLDHVLDVLTRKLCALAGARA